MNQKQALTADFHFKHWKRYLAISAGIIAVGIYLFSAWNPNQNKAIIDHHGTPHPALIQLFHLTKVPFKKGMTLGEVTHNTRKQWFQGAQKERWEFENRFEVQRMAIVAALQALEMVNERKPQVKHYTYAWIHGALAQSIELRIQYLITQWKQGVRFQEIVLLAGDRALEPIKEKIWTEKGLKTESEVMEWLWKNTHKPQALQSLPYRLIKASQWVDQNGQPKRPGTKDTIWAWLKQYPEPGRILAISHQPFCTYQHVGALGVLPMRFKLETIGPAASDVTPVSVYLDNLARVIYEINLQNG